MVSAMGGIQNAAAKVAVRQDPMGKGKIADPRQRSIKRLDGFQGPEKGVVVPSAQSASKRREAPRGSSVVPPTVCELCVPIVRIVEDSYFLTISEASHEAGCPNHPSNHTQLSKEPPAWSTQSSA
jgi:hypothetical protein